MRLGRPRWPPAGLEEPGAVAVLNLPLHVLATLLVTNVGTEAHAFRLSADAAGDLLLQPPLTVAPGATEAIVQHFHDPDVFSFSDPDRPDEMRGEIHGGGARERARPAAPA